MSPKTDIELSERLENEIQQDFSVSKTLLAILFGALLGAAAVWWG